MRRISSWARSIPATSVSSETCSDSPSTIMMASLVPATTMSRALLARSDSVGLMTISPSTKPTRTAPIGPSHGICERVSAAEAPLIERMSGSFSWSADITVVMTCTSDLYPLGNNGRIGRSVRRAARVAASVGRPSRLMNPPGIFPAAYIRSS